MKIHLEIDLANLYTKAELRGIADKLLPFTANTPVVVSKATTVAPDDVADEITSATSDDSVEWEYAPKFGQRRNKTEIALHKKEVELNRLLTPEEKGETDAHVELDDEAEAQAKVDTKNKVRIDGIAAEATEAAAQELADEAETAEATIEEVTGHDGQEIAAMDDELDAVTSSDGINDLEEDEEEEATIPKTEELSTINSLFS